MRNRLVDLARDFDRASGFLDQLKRWFRQVSEEVNVDQRGLDKYSVVKNWHEIAASIQQHEGLMLVEGGAEYKAMQNVLSGLVSKKDDDKKEDDLNSLRPNSNAIGVLEKFLNFLQYFTMHDNRHRNTYRMFVCLEKAPLPECRRVSNSQFVPPFAFASDASSPSFFVESKPILHGYKVTVNLWCMSPAVAFLDAFEHTRSVVLASGTLCPTETFQTELGVDFPSRMEGEQVIPKERIFASVLSVGPKNRPLRATYQNTSAIGNDDFVAELSLVVKAICERIPFGVLCFLPSYRLLERLYGYMAKSGLLSQLAKIKEVVCEPRRSSDLDQAFRLFDEAISSPKNFGSDRTGALLLAVFRGKVSEGIDFADDRARCVIAVGIPFPNARDDLAYRALNQALGRCLRHRSDWGALVLVDERFIPPRNGTSRGLMKISRWIRELLRRFDSFEEFQFGLTNFVRKMSSDQLTNDR